MITIQLTPDDLVNMRFAFDPLMEIPSSFRVLRNPTIQSQHLRWVDEASRAIYDLELPYLEALLPPLRACTPEFLTPTPSANRIDIEDALEQLLATPSEQIRQNIRKLIAVDGNSAMRQYFLTHPREAMHCLVDEIRVYWRRTLAHYWSRMMSIIEGDILYRGRTLALDGPGALFTDLHTTIAYKAGQLHIQPTAQTLQTDRHVELAGHGVQLVPTVISGYGRYLSFPSDARMMLAYNVRGTGLWQREKSSKNQSLELAIGAGRARVLQLLRTPSSNSEVSLKARITASTASQHLLRLSKAGLIEPQRNGKRIYYSLTARGRNLLDLFDSSD